MEQYIKKFAVVAEIKKLMGNPELIEDWRYRVKMEQKNELLKNIINTINTLEVKEVNEVPATVTVNKYGNRFISSWSGLKEYDGFKEREEIKILIPKK